jgi:hypothetical protein
MGGIVNYKIKELKNEIVEFWGMGGFGVMGAMADEYVIYGTFQISYHIISNFVTSII